MLYVAYAVGIFSMSGYTSVRSFLSKLVRAEDEVGKAMATVGLVQVGAESQPNQQRVPLINFRQSSDAGILLISTGRACKLAPNVQKRVRNAYVFQLGFHFACHRCWLGKKKHTTKHHPLPTISLSLLRLWAASSLPCTTSSCTTRPCCGTPASPTASPAPWTSPTSPASPSQRPSAQGRGRRSKQRKHSMVFSWHYNCYNYEKLTLKNSCFSFLLHRIKVQREKKKLKCVFLTPSNIYVEKY